MIDFKRNKDGIGQGCRHRVRSNRTAFIALLNYADGEALHPGADRPEDRRHRDQRRGRGHQAGNALPIRNIPLGTLIHNIELVPGRGVSSSAAPATPLS